MAKDLSDKATIDLLAPNPRGGYRPRAGRKPSSEKKVKIGWHVSVAAKNNIEKLAKEKKCTPSEILNRLMLRAKELPKDHSD